jgi:sulfoxide reductase heme-binding subunit YedZ
MRVSQSARAAAVSGSLLGRLSTASIAVWALRALLLIPFVLMGPEIFAVVMGRPDAVAHVSASTADVLGTSTFLVFVMLLTVTPINTITGWRWHLVLRRDYGVGMFAVAMTDLILAATTTGDTFPGGLPARIGGHTFLLAGTLSALLLVPLAVTANRRAQRWLGPHWKWIQKLTYVVWVTVLIHLYFLFDLSTFFVDAVIVSLPLVVLRVPAVRTWWTSSRRRQRHPRARAVAAIALIGVFAAGYVPFAHELAVKGSAAFVQHPGND